MAEDQLDDERKHETSLVNNRKIVAVGSHLQVSVLNQVPCHQQIICLSAGHDTHFQHVVQESNVISESEGEAFSCFEI